MLVLSRKRDEKVLIGDDVVVTVVQTRSNGCRLGFEADPSIPVVRWENVSAAKKAELLAAGRVRRSDVTEG